MAKKPDLITVQAGYLGTTALNSNFQAIETAFENTLSLDGSTPNAMQAELDMNSNDIINVGAGNINLGDAVVGPTTSTDNAVARFDGITGQILDDSLVTIDDTGTLTAPFLVGDGSGITGLTPAPVDSVFSRTGAVVAQVGDYTAAQVTNAFDKSADDSDDITEGTTNLFNRVPAGGTGGQVLSKIDGADYNIEWSAAGSGDVTGPVSSTDNALARYDSTTGKIIQNSGVTLDDTNNIAGVGDINSKTVDDLVEGPASATDNSVARYDATTGKLIQGSGVLIDDSNNITGVNDLAVGDIDNIGVTLKNQTSTGLISGGIPSINGVDNTKFDVSAGSGIVVDNTTDPMNPSITEVTWSAFSSQTVTNIGTQLVTYLSIDSAGTLVQRSSFPSATQRRTDIFLGVLVHSNLTNLNAINDIPTVGLDIAAQLEDTLRDAIGFQNVSGNDITANGSNLSIDKAAGRIFKAGVGFDTLNSDPHGKSMALLTAATFRYRTQNGTEGSDTTFVDPTNYDVSGTVTALPGNNQQATIQRVNLFASNQIRLQYGQTLYSNIADALNNFSTDPFVTESNIAENGLLLGYIIVRKGALDLSDTGDARIIPVGAAATSISGATLQSAYDNSTEPEINTNASQGAVSIKSATGTDTDLNLEILNNAGTVTASVSAGGMIEATTLDLVHTATGADDHALEVDVFADGNGDVKGVDVAYNTGAITTGDDEAAVLVSIDESASTGGEVAALEVLTTAVGSAEVDALLAGAQVNPLKHFAGTFGNADSILNNAVDVLTALSTGGAGNITVFAADNDTITIGSAAKFEEIEFIFDTVAGQNVRPTFEYSTGVGTWSTFTPTDGTNGFRNSGAVLWLDSDIPSWAVGTGSEYLIRITRTRNALSTAPILDLVQISALTEYCWDMNGDVNINSLTAPTITSQGNTLDLTAGAPEDNYVLTFDNATNKWQAEASSGSASPLTTKGDIFTYDTGDARLPVGTDGFVLSADSAEATGLKWIAAGGGGGGKTLQVLQTEKSDSFSTTSTTFTPVTGLSQSITPASTSNKVLVTVMLSWAADALTNQSEAVLKRDSTQIAIGDASGSRSRCTTRCNTLNNKYIDTQIISFLDSPSTTSAVTYSVDVRCNLAGTTVVNRSVTDTNSSTGSRVVSTITVEEIEV